MDKNIYKLGVQIRGASHTALQGITLTPGDEAKLTRDYPDVFPKGIESTVDLSSIARRADPIGTGPGRSLIALNELAKRYLGRQLEKGEVRSGNWSKRLDAKQIKCEWKKCTRRKGSALKSDAANDVVSSVEIYKALLKVARTNEIDIDLKDLVGGDAWPAAAGDGHIDINQRV